MSHVNFRAIERYLRERTMVMPIGSAATFNP
jgi:hypothetical protein